MTTFVCGLCPSNNLRARNGYPLVRTTCNYNIVDVYTVTDLVQEYQSMFTNPEQSISYVFPLPPSAAVCSFKAVIDGSKVIKGNVMEKRKAKEVYEAAVAQGKQAGLLEKGSVDIFQISLGNIKPLQTVSVHISFVSTISHDGEDTDSLRLTVPVTIGERYGYAPYEDMNSNKQSTFALNVSVQMNAPVTSISSPTHPISMILGRHANETTDQLNPFKAHISLHSETFLDKDVVLIIAAQKLDHPRCNVERWLAKDGAEETTDAYALTFVPKVDLPPIQAQEYIFLVDRSGSMSGGRIESVKNALQIMLRSLPSRKTTFNVISFGSNFTSLWNTSQVYSSDTVDKASQHVETFGANYGGTELASALRFAYSSKAGVAGAEKPATSLFILTDGDSYDLRGVTDVVTGATKEASKANHLLRTFVLAVGDGVSVGMCESIARAGDGTAVFVGSKEKPDAKLVGLLRAARGGVIHNVSIEWGNKVADLKEEFELVEKEDAPPAVPPTNNDSLSLFDPAAQVSATSGELGPKEIEVKLAPPPVVQQAPRSDTLVFPIYPGFRCCIFAIIKPSSDTDSFASSVKIKGSVMDRPVTLDIPIQSINLANLGSEAVISKPQLIHTLAARALVERFDDQPESPATKAEIVRLGKRYSIATSQTSFVAVEESGENADGKPAVVEKDSYAMPRMAMSAPAPPVMQMKMAADSDDDDMDAMAMFQSIDYEDDEDDEDDEEDDAPPVRKRRRSRGANPCLDLAATVDEDDEDDVMDNSAPGAIPRYQDEQHEFDTVGDLYVHYNAGLENDDESPPPPEKESSPPQLARRVVQSPVVSRTPRPGAKDVATPRKSPVTLLDRLSEDASHQTTSIHRLLASESRILLAFSSTHPQQAPPLAARKRSRASSDEEGDEEAEFADLKKKKKKVGNSEPPPTATIPSLSLSSLAKAQDFDGGFKGTEHNMKFLLQGSAKETAAIPSALDAVKNISAEDKATVWTTIITLVVLEKRFGSKEERSAWCLLGEKAVEFVTGVLSDAGLAAAEVEKLISELKAEAGTIV